MKRVIVLFAFFFSIQMSFARDLTEILNQREQKCMRYNLKTDLLDAYVIQMPFGSSSTISSIDYKFLRNADVRQIDLVYSDFPQAIDLSHLNKERIAVMNAVSSKFVKDESITWRIIRQIGCKNEAEAKTLFHGIVVHYKGEQTEEEWKAERLMYEHFLPEVFPTIAEAEKMLTDKSVLTILDRNKHWKNMAVVADFTGSMGPYAQQLVFWFKLRIKDERVKTLTFFNDGNMTPEHLKVIGKIGGIYHATAKDYESARKLALTTITQGNGGDCPENDIEALLVAIEKSPANADIVLIADNYAPIKDYELLDKVTKPVHVILCGAQIGINIQYLQLAYKTKGSIHTMEKDLNDLYKMNEGERIVIGREVFEVKGGTIQKVVFKAT